MDLLGFQILHKTMGRVKKCFVFGCRNDSKNSPHKYFFWVPCDKKQRKIWYEQARTEDKVQEKTRRHKFSKSNQHCCEDHFDFSTDADNSMQVKLLGRGTIRPKLKPGVVPHIFACQDRGDTSGAGFTRKTRTVRVQRDRESGSEQEPGEEDEHGEMMEEEEENGDDGDWKPDSDGTDEEVDEGTRLKKQSRDRIRMLARTHPMKYLGLNEHCLFVIDILADLLQFTDKGHLCKGDILLLVLMKIRLNLPFSLLSDEFGVSESYCARLFSRFVPVVAKYLKEAIFMHNAATIKANLPLAFKANFRNVNSLIDCFEIQMCKPADSLKQGLSWSSYKSTNTAKYLISVTPDGMITFVSEGETGRVTDAALFQKSSVVDHLPPGSVVMADRGFKACETTLASKSMRMIRPPSVSNAGKMTKLETLQTKRIASLRIHVERVIGRIRLYKMLEPHAATPNALLDRIDDAVVIACGLINMQSRITKI